MSLGGARGLNALIQRKGVCTSCDAVRSDRAFASAWTNAAWVDVGGVPACLIGQRVLVLTVVMRLRCSALGSRYKTTTGPLLGSLANRYTCAAGKSRCRRNKIKTHRRACVFQQVTCSA